MNRVIWQEGLFLRPQHFQQQERFLLNWVEERCSVVRPYNWGFTELVIDKESLSLGKLVIQSCRGVFPDGTPFDAPNKTSPPEPLNVPTDTMNCRVYLGVPLHRSGEKDVNDETNRNSFARYQITDTNVRDVYTAGMDEAVELQTGSLRLSILTEQDDLQSYHTIPLAHIKEKSSDQRISLEPKFIPTTMYCGADQSLSSFILEIQGLLKSRGDELAKLMVAPDASGTAGVSNFLQLQLINRYEPLFRHLSTVFEIHPEGIYRLMLELAGEFSTFSKAERRPINLPAYQHDDLENSFSPLAEEIRSLFSVLPDQKAIPLHIKEYNNNYWLSKISDKTLINNARFILAAKSELPQERLEQEFPRKTIISTTEKVQSLVCNQTLGIPIKLLRSNPTQIPIHAGFSYFELSKSHEHWELLMNSVGLGFHFTSIPGLELELWAILS